MNHEKKHKTVGIYILVILFSVAFLMVGNRIASAHPVELIITDYESELESQVFAKVTKIDSAAPNPDDGSTNIVLFSAVITAGEQKGTSVQARSMSIKTIGPCRPRCG